MKFESTLTRQGGYHLFPVPVELGDQLQESGTHRMRLTIDGEHTYSLALHHRKEGTYYLMIGQARLRQAGIRPGQTCSLELVPDHSKYGMEVPDVFREVMETDPEAFTRFEALSPGKQRSILHQIGSAKRIETQIERALKIAENLKRYENDH